MKRTLAEKKTGKRGRGAAGKALVVIAVEDNGDEGIGRIRLSLIKDASACSLNEFLREAVKAGSTIRTDDWNGYNEIVSIGYSRATVPSLEMKLAHLVASLLKRWLLGTYQGAVRPTHLSFYLDEFTFRFNRRTSASRGKLFYRLVQQSLMVDPAPISELRSNDEPQEQSHIEQKDFDEIDF